MPPKRTNKQLPCSASECGNRDTSCMLISCDPLHVTSQITSESVTPSVLQQVEIKEASDHECRIINNNKDPPSNDKSNCGNAILKNNDSMHDYIKQLAPPLVNLAKMVEQQAKIIEFLVKQKTKLIE